MLSKINLEKILFLDIETVPAYPSYDVLPTKFKNLWDKKARYIKKEQQTPADVYAKAGIYAEFGKIIVISYGYLLKKNNEITMVVKALSNSNEKDILLKFNALLTKYLNTDKHYLCAHNGKEFDFPYIARRSLVNGVKPAKILNTPGAKPWEVRHLDTLELWRFGDYKNWTSLELLTAIFDIPSPKNDIDGSQVYQVYWHDCNLNRIAEYCKNDVVALIQLFLRYNNLPIIPSEMIKIL